MLRTILFLFIFNLPIMAREQRKEVKLQENVTTANYMIKQIRNPNQNITKQLQLEISGLDINWNIQLVPNRYVVNLHYKRPSSYKNASTTDCEFTGFLTGFKDSWAAFTMCDGLRGIVYVDGKEIEIFSLMKHNTTAGILSLKNFTERDVRQTKCGVHENNSYNSLENEIEMAAGEKYRMKRSLETEVIMLPNITTTSWHRYIEIFIVVDRSLYLHLDSSLSKVHRKCQEIMNIVYGIFQPLEISIVLVQVEVWKDRDKIGVISDHVETLKRFKSQRLRLLQEHPHHDFTLLLTAVDFIGKTVGYAFVKEMCHPERSAAVVQYSIDETVASIAGTIAHEIGHGLGANHDKENCQTDNNEGFGIMIGESMIRLHWSNCSKIYFAKYIDTFHCLRNVPTSEYVENFCGNGIIDEGEQCDCGINGACEKCCNMVHCTLKTNATCGSGLCCNYKNCKPYPSGTMCRQAGSACDLPEYCSGRAPYCPKDVYKIDGFPCDDNNGHCYQGKCGSRDLLCQDLINPAAKSPLLETMERYSHYEPSTCGEFYCQPHLNISWDWQSKAIINDQHYYRYSLSPLIKYKMNGSYYDNRPRMNGVPCADGKMCVKKSCVGISQNAGTHCVANCSNHGVCNSEGNCHCDDNYAPPDCLSYGYGGSLNSGHARRPPGNYTQKILLLIIFFGIIPAIIILCFLWSKLSKLWRDKWNPNVEEICPLCSMTINRCCCPCMNFLTKWTSYIQPNIGNSSTNNESRRYSRTKRATICEVDVNIKTPAAKIKSWGVADSMLATDIIQVTPKDSPDMRRKIRLPAGSPVMRPKSEDVSSHRRSNICSKNSDVPSSDDEVSFTPSMGSLISIFNKFGRQRSRNEEQNVPCVSHISSSRPHDLRRIAVDPLSRRALQDSTLSNKSNVSFNRSVSENPSGRNVSQLNPSLLSQSLSNRTHNTCKPKGSLQDNFNMNQLGTKSKPLRPPTSRSISHPDQVTNKCPPIIPSRSTHRTKSREEI